MRNRLLRSIARLSFKRHRIHVKHQRQNINAVSDAIPVLTMWQDRDHPQLIIGRIVGRQQTGGIFARNAHVDLPDILSSISLPSRWKVAMPRLIAER
jgi:hypothetical protein